ncbi:MAG: 16S rRNA (cytidine(1402)-2'-O)-methyltransferase [Polyangiales bacterium]
MTGRLSVVATPIGCLEDISARALRILGEADAILAEDTRHTRTLCARYDLRTPLRSFHEHTDERKVSAIVQELAGGAHFALVSDAGTPVVSDPGVYLVSRASAAGVVVEAIPGPSAVLAALSVAGIPIRRFTFEGFLPRSGRDRQEALRRVGTAQEASVLFESPHRIRKTLDDLGEVLGVKRKVALCRELTKMHEQTIRGTVDEVRAALAESIKGEITLVIEAAPKQSADPDVDVEARVAAWKEEGLSTKEMTQRLQREAGWRRNDAYRAILTALGDDST